MTTKLYAKVPKVLGAPPTEESFGPPKRCTVHGCSEKTQIAVLVVRDGGEVVSGMPSDYMNGKGLDSRYEFVAWVTRCTNHYLKDLYRRGRGVWSGFAEDPDGIPTIDDYRRLHGNGEGVRGSADGGEPRGEAADMGADQSDLTGPGGVPDGMEGAGRDDYRDSVRRAVGGRWDAYG